MTSYAIAVMGCLAVAASARPISGDPESTPPSSARAMARTPVVEDRPVTRAYGPQVIAITFGDSFDPKAGMLREGYKVQSADEQRIAVARIGLESKIARYIEKGWPYKPVVQHTVFLALTNSAKAGDSMVIAVDRGVTGQALELSCRYDPTAVAADLIKVNQVGYLPNTPRKLAYLGGYLGDLGPLGLQDTNGRFEIIDRTSGKVAFAGKATLSKAADSESGENVYWLDFSDFKTANGRSGEGDYVIQVNGVGRSHPFRIAADVYRRATVTAGRGLYHQRCGVALEKPYTTWTHGICHRGKAKLVDFHDSMDDCMKTLPQHVDASGKLIDGWGGWHDAADYDRLGSRHIQTVCDLLDAYEANPSAFADKQWNIPESGNGMPDVLDEARWGLDWFERMYDPSDGGFYYRIETEKYGWTMPEQDEQQLYSMSKYPYYSCLAGVPFAQAARVFRPLDAKLAGRYLEIARSALRYGRAQAKAPKPDGRVPSALPLLAAEIYCSSGDAECHKIFLDSSRRDSWAYAVCHRPDINAEAQAACRRKFTASADELLRRQRTAGYVTCLPAGEGGDRALFDAATLVKGCLVSGRAEFRAAALSSLDHHLAPTRWDTAG